MSPRNRHYGGTPSPHDSTAPRGRGDIRRPLGAPPPEGGSGGGTRTGCGPAVLVAIGAVALALTLGSSPVESVTAGLAAAPASSSARPTQTPARVTVAALPAEAAAAHHRVERIPPQPVWVHPLPGACRPATGGGQFGAARSGYAHQGIDLGGIEHMPIGTPVHAIGGGVVTFAGPAGRAGNQVKELIGGRLEVRYNHFATIAVHAGQWVNPGATLGGMGETGNATGPHTHIEIRDGGRLLNPVTYLRSVGVEVGC